MYLPKLIWNVLDLMYRNVQAKMHKMYFLVRLHTLENYVFQIQGLLLKIVAVFFLKTYYSRHTYLF